MLSFLLTDASVNKDRVLKICLVHDLAEAVVGDITPFDGKFICFGKMRAPYENVINIFQQGFQRKKNGVSKK